MRIVARALLFACALSGAVLPAAGPALAEELPVNLAIWYPLSVNRTETADVGVNLSLIYGRVGDVGMLDLSGIASVVEYDARWLQLTGVAGVVGERFDGIQFAGAANVVGENLSGIQIGGAANIAGEAADGLQLAGFANIAGKTLQGMQLSGFANVAGDGAEGLQFTGFANVTGDAMQGMQIGGFANIGGNVVEGLQLAGFASIAGDGMEGIQASGFANIAGGDVDGLQVAGFANIAGENLEGWQLGVVNVAGNEARGLQMGVANVAGEQRGLPLGLYLREEEAVILDFVLYGSSLGAANMGIYTEANRWYSMVSLGSFNLSQEIDEALISAWHFGRRFPVGDWDLGLDLGVLHVDNEELFRSGPNDREAVQARVLATRIVADHAAVFAGAGLTWLYDREAEDGEGEPLFLAGVRVF